MRYVCRLLWINLSPAKRTQISCVQARKGEPFLGLLLLNCLQLKIFMAKAFILVSFNRNIKPDQVWEGPVQGSHILKKFFLFNREGYLTHLKQSPGITPHCVQKTVGRIWFQALLLRGKGGHQGIRVSTDIVMANQYMVFINFISLIQEPLDESERGE